MARCIQCSNWVPKRNVFFLDQRNCNALCWILCSRCFQSSIKEKLYDFHLFLRAKWENKKTGISKLFLQENRAKKRSQALDGSKPASNYELSAKGWVRWAWVESRRRDVINPRTERQTYVVFKTRADRRWRDVFRVRIEYQSAMCFFSIRGIVTLCAEYYVADVFKVASKKSCMIYSVYCKQSEKIRKL